MTIRVTVSAKVNLFLAVGKKRKDGFHDLETIFHTVGLHDRLEFRPSERLTLISSGIPVPKGRMNLVLKAAELLQSETRCGKGASIRLVKRIPTGAGLGGGSADAAGTLLGLNRLWNLRLPPATLLRLAARIGSDVPFFMIGGAAVGTGRGEKLRPIPSQLDAAALILKPKFAMPTKDAYAALDRTTHDRAGCRSATLAGVERAVRHGDLDSLHTHNDFEQPVFHLHPSLLMHRARMLVNGGHPVVLAGSGSALVGICRNLAIAQAAKRALARTIPGFSLFTVPLRPETIRVNVFGG